MKGILGRKLGMTQIFADNGKCIPVTVVEAGPCRVVRIRTVEKDGYEATQLGFIEVNKKSSLSKPIEGFFKKAGLPAYKVLKEFKMSGYSVGDFIKTDLFSVGDVVSVSGISKGKGFQGVVKRHKFRGGPASHGSTFYRAPGSIGASSFPSRVWKGMRMAGHMGNRRVTIKNLKIIDIKPDLNLILIKGALPGAQNAIIEIWKD
ncbi:MAG: 50S ribosomal protein L3 [Thermodesulfovibrionales bacterium]|nr:50S ribosomal protein L3 [Thermodesulfovibrionales bacterium]